MSPGLRVRSPQQRFPFVDERDANPLQRFTKFGHLEIACSMTTWRTLDRTRIKNQPFPYDIYDFRRNSLHSYYSTNAHDVKWHSRQRHSNSNTPHPGGAEISLPRSCAMGDNPLGLHTHSSVGVTPAPVLPVILKIPGEVSDESDRAIALH
jgi:hypothetical protein